VAAASPAASEPPKSGIPVPPQSPTAVAQPPATPAPEPSAQTQPAATEAKPTPPQAELAHAAPSRRGTKGAGTKDSALARFERDIQKAGKRVIDKRRLPELANMGKNWTGKAEIEVQFAAGGYISRIVLAESCGNTPLDEKALELARSIMFPHVPKELSSRDFNVRFPIEFRPGKGE
jgi:TonB family protein